MGPGWPTPLQRRRRLDDAADHRTRAAARGRTTFQAQPGARPARRLGRRPRRVRRPEQGPQGAAQGAERAPPSCSRAARSDLGRLEHGLGQAGDGASQLRSGLGSAADGAGQLQAGSGTAGSGAGQAPRRARPGTRRRRCRSRPACTTRWPARRALQDRARPRRSPAQSSSPAALGQAAEPGQGRAARLPAARRRRRHRARAWSTAHGDRGAVRSRPARRGARRARER